MTDTFKEFDKELELDTLRAALSNCMKDNERLREQVTAWKHLYQMEQDESERLRKLYEKTAVDKWKADDELRVVTAKMYEALFKLETKDP